MHRILQDNITEFHEFSGQKLSKVLKKVSKFAEAKEAEYASLFIQQHWDEESGFIVYVFVAE